MNFLKAKVVGKSEELYYLDLCDNSVICKSNSYNFDVGDTILFCIRPEKLYINPNKKLTNTINSKLVRIIYRGNNLEIGVLIGDIELRAICECKRWKKSHFIGGSIHIGWEVEDALLFPMEMKEDIINYTN